jgi:hypothetical protein
VPILGDHVTVCEDGELVAAGSILGLGAAIDEHLVTPGSLGRSRFKAA